MEKKVWKLRTWIYLLGMIAFVITTSFHGVRSELPSNPCKKIYIDREELDTEHDSFHIHLGNNVWIETNTVNRDASGLYTLECSILTQERKNGREVELQKSWKCPYCYMYWPIGTPCQNKDCPSRYR